MRVQNILKLWTNSIWMPLVHAACTCTCTIMQCSVASLLNMYSATRIVACPSQFMTCFQFVCWFLGFLTSLFILLWLTRSLTLCPLHWPFVLGHLLADWPENETGRLKGVGQFVLECDQVNPKNASKHISTEWATKRWVGARTNATFTYNHLSHSRYAYNVQWSPSWFGGHLTLYTRMTDKYVKNLHALMTNDI